MTLVLRILEAARRRLAVLSREASLFDAAEVLANRCDSDRRAAGVITRSDVVIETKNRNMVSREGGKGGKPLKVSSSGTLRRSNQWHHGDSNGSATIASLLPAVIATELLGGLAIILGWKTRAVAVLLAGFSLWTALIFHNNFADQTQMSMFLKDVSIAGGFLLLIANGAGPLSLDRFSAR